jgi:hypothetical protein
VDIIRRPHTEGDGTKEIAGGEYRPELKAYRGCYSAEGFQSEAIARFASLKSASHTPAAPPLGGAFLMRQLRQRADTRHIDVGALARERDATDWVPSSESRIWNKPGVTAGREPAERL